MKVKLQQIKILAFKVTATERDTLLICARDKFDFKKQPSNKVETH
jgi:hypothetical protein